MSGTIRQCEKYWDVLNIEQGSSKSGKTKATNLKGKPTSVDSLHIIGDIEFWTTGEEDVSYSCTNGLDTFI